MNSLVVLASLIATTMAAGYNGGFGRSFGGWRGKGFGGWGRQLYYGGKGGWGGRGYYGIKGGFGGWGNYGISKGAGFIAPIGISYGGFNNIGFARPIGYQLQQPQIQSQVIIDNSLMRGLDLQKGVTSVGNINGAQIGGNVGGVTGIKTTVVGNFEDGLSHDDNGFRGFSDDNGNGVLSGISGHNDDNGFSLNDDSATLVGFTQTGQINQGNLISQGNVINQGNLISQGSIINQGGLMSKGGLINQGGLMSKGGLINQGGLMSKGGLINQGGLMSKGGLINQGGLMSKGGLINQGGLMSHGGLVNQGFGVPAFGPVVGAVNGFNGLQGMKTGLRPY